LLGPARIVVPPRDGNQLHPDQVKRPLVEVHERNPIRLVVMDMKAAEDIAAWIEDELGCRVVDRTQGNAMQVVDYDRFMAALRNGWLHHSGDPGLSRHALNAIARVLPQGDTRFDRPHVSRFGSQRGREIDALVAAAMVHTVACEEPRASVYETRGVIVV
jgi:phage terminase large subunit-like protein